MWSADAELRRILKRLKQLVSDEFKAAKGAASLAAHIAEANRLMLLGANARGASKLIAEAVVLLERADPLANLLAAKIDYIDHLSCTCDRLMHAGQMPDPAYLHALAEAVCDLEMHGGDRASAELVFAWDILAQAEAGLGQAVDETHYAVARQRYHPRPPAEAPVLAVVGGTAV